YLPSKESPMIVANPNFGEKKELVSQTTNKNATKDNNLEESRKVDFSKFYFKPLPGTAKEAEAISEIIPKARLYTQTEATKANLLKAAAPKILHIATHGFFLFESPAKTTAPDNQVASRAIASEFDGRSSSELIKATAEKLNPLLRSGLALA